MKNSGYTYVDRIRDEASGMTLLDFYATRYGHSTREEWARRIESGAVLRNGQVSTVAATLDPGDELTYRRESWVEPEAPVDFAVLHEDEHVLAVAKPSGLPVLPGGHYLENTLLSVVRKRYPDGADPVHRLGRGTSGIVLFARTADAGRSLSQDLDRRRITKIYRALVTGDDLPGTVTVDTPIGPVPYPGVGRLHAASDQGRPSRSDVRVLERRDGCSLVEVDILTGRPHQIRIHLAAAGHPLVGDPLYVAGGLPVSAPDSNGRWPLPGDVGYHLHAHRIEFRHPASGILTGIECLPPPVLRTS